MIGLIIYEDFELKTKRLRLKIPDPGLYMSVLSYYKDNLNYFAPALPDLPDDFLTPEHQLRRCFHEDDLFLQNKFIRFYCFHSDSNNALNDESKIIGDISLANIQLGAISTAVLGYKISEFYAGKGFCSEAVEKVIDFSFNQLELKRLETVIRSDNAASIRIAEKFGFKFIETVESYMMQNGIAQDFLRYNLENPLKF